MFGKKDNFMETFVFEPGCATLCLGHSVAGLVLAELLREKYAKKHSISYKGRRIYNKHTCNWEVELEKYKGVRIHGCYFLDSSGHYVQRTSDNCF